MANNNGLASLDIEAAKTSDLDSAKTDLGPDPKLEKTCLGVDGYTTDFLLMDTGTLPLIVIPFLNWNSCPAAPSMPAFVLTLALVLSIKNVLHLWFKLSKDSARLQRENQSRPEVIALNALGALIIPSVIWGAVVTYPNFKYHGTELCQNAIFIPAFILTTIVITILIAMIVYYSFFNKK